MPSGLGPGALGIEVGKVWGGFRVFIGFRVSGLGFRVWSSGFGSQGSGFRV